MAGDVVLIQDPNKVRGNWNSAMYRELNQGMAEKCESVVQEPKARGDSGETPMVRPFHCPARTRKPIHIDDAQISTQEQLPRENKCQ